MYTLKESARVLKYQKLLEVAMVHSIRFAKDCEFLHMPGSPEYLRSNGLAEETIQTKNPLEKAKEDNKNPL